jgi:DNA-binding MarR family transcriptional regulator
MNDRSPGEIEARFRAMLERSGAHVDMSAMELFRNIMISSHILDCLAERRAARHDLSTAKLRILFWLKMRAEDGAEGGGLLPSELSRFQGVTPNTMSSLLNSLRESGLIEQINHPQDRRKRIIKITAKAWNSYEWSGLSITPTSAICLRISAKKSGRSSSHFCASSASPSKGRWPAMTLPWRKRRNRHKAHR